MNWMSAMHVKLSQFFGQLFISHISFKVYIFSAFTEKERDSNMLSLWISVVGIVIALMIGFVIFVSINTKMKGKTEIKDCKI